MHFLENSRTIVPVYLVTGYKAMLMLVIVTFCVLAQIAQASDGTITQAELLQKLDSDAAPLILDVRSPAEYRAGHIPNAINIPYDQLEGRLGQILAAKNREVVTYCEQGPRAYIAESVLRKAGFPKIRHLEGDMSLWRNKQLPVVSAP